MFARILFNAFLCFILSALPLAAKAGTPRVVVSVSPIHSLVAGVMAGVGSPELLIRGDASAHDFALRPSTAKSLHDADLIIYVSREFEKFLQGPLATLPKGKARILALEDIPGLRIYSVRKTVNGYVSSVSDDQTRTDPHLWLDPLNAILIARHISEVLAREDPRNGRRYKQNTDHVVRKLTALDNSIKKRVSLLDGGSTPTPYLSFHDAFQYFERRYRLPVFLFLADNAELGLRPVTVEHVRSRIAKATLRCIFHEPQSRMKILADIASVTGARLLALDPEGGTYPPGPDAYFQMLEDIAAATLSCMGG